MPYLLSAGGASVASAARGLLLLAIRRETFVLKGPSRAPTPSSEVLLPLRIRLEVPVITVVGEAYAYSIRFALLCDIGRLDVLVALPVGARMIPHDEVQSLPRGDVVCPMPLAAQVADAAALDVSVRHRVPPVVRRAHQAAELKTGAFEVQAQADIEGHVGVVRVHVEAEVLARTIPHDETVLAIPRAASTGEQQLA